MKITTVNNAVKSTLQLGSSAVSWCLPGGAYWLLGCFLLVATSLYTLSTPVFSFTSSPLVCLDLESEELV